MANPKRAMVTLRKIDKVEPIEGADRIEVASVGGWRVVVKKGEFKEGDIALYHEIDSFLDTSKPEYSFLDGNKTMVIDGKEVTGHVLKTRKMRGVYSQGLLIDPHQVFDLSDEKLQELCEKRANMSKACGVVEYYKPMPLGAKDFIGRYDDRFAPRTDATRVQNIDQETWDMVKQTYYQVSVKVDGTSITIVKPSEDEELAIFSHNNRFALDRGMGKLVLDVATEQGIMSFCEQNPGITVQCELCGPKIQGDRLRLGKHRLFVFSIYDTTQHHYLTLADMDGMNGLNSLIESHVPIVEAGSKVLDQFETPSDFLSYADGIRGNVTKNCLDEGLVVHLYDKGMLSDEDWTKLCDELGRQLQVKAVSNTFLLKVKG